jgi:stage V sporulation protein R
LVLNHKMHNGKPLDKKNMTEITKHMYRLWEHPIVVQSVDQDGDVVDEISCPEKRKSKRGQQLRLH